MEKKLENSMRRKLLASIMILVIMFPISIVQAADDANNREVGVEWVQNYGPCGIGNLGSTRADAESFYNALGNRGWTKSFNWGDGNAWESDFEKEGVGGSDISYADNVDFAYFSGHGSRDSVWFGTPHDGNGAIPCRVHTSEASWGETDLEWLVLSVCLTLQFDNWGVFDRWSPAFQGLHQILSYDTISYDAVMGDTFVKHMTGYWSGFWFWQTWNPPKTIRNAWTQANIERQPSDVWSATLSTCDSWNDYLPGYGSVSSDASNSCMIWQKVQS